MQLNEIIDLINKKFISKNANILQLKRIEDNENYNVWLIINKDSKYILKETSNNEIRNYKKFLSVLKEGVPSIYQTMTFNGKNYIVLEYIEGEDLCKCTHEKLVSALDALISIQKITWETDLFNDCFSSFDESLQERIKRGKYLNNKLLEEAYDKFIEKYQVLPKSLCHDDLLPFNIISDKDKATLIDWEHCGFIPYPTSFARLIAHFETEPKALFYMTKEDKDFAIKYYYDKLLKDKGISYDEWLETLEYFLFYEYCEWIYVGNKYNDTSGFYYKKYLPIAINQAKKILKVEN